MPSPNANPTPITPPRVPLIDPRTNLIDRAWYLFFLSLNNIASAVVDNGDIGTNTDSLLASYDAALRSVNQELQTLPPVVTLPAPDVLGDCCSALVSQTAEMQKQIDGILLQPTASSYITSLGYVTGPASSTDNAISRFDGTSGKIIDNSVVTIDDTGATTGITTLTASTSVTTPIVQASNSAGLSLKNASGTTQMNVGAGGGDNMSVNVSTNLNGTNAQIDISPTGTGHVHIKPSGTGSIEIAPTNVGTIDNMTIGATTAKNASVVDLSVTGTLSFDSTQGTAGQVLTSAGTGVTPTWTTPTTGTVTSISVVSANGLAGTSSGGATPALTLSTSITGILKGNGTAISAAVANTDYMGVGAPVTKTADFTVANGEIWYINNKSGSTCTVTLPAASSWTGRTLTFKNMQAQTLVSASSNVVLIDSTTAGTAILLAVVGNWATMVSDGTNWVIMQQAANNTLLLE
jgi:hypothetical protein